MPPADVHYIPFFTSVFTYVGFAVLTLFAYFRKYLDIILGRDSAIPQPKVC
jgi:hypothetical protein